MLNQISNFKQRLLCTAILTASPLAFAQTETNAAPNNEKNIEEVLVTGIRQSVQKSIDIKRNAGSVVDSITATDIGKLPDATIADSLQRIPGIQITRSGGEGAVVNIRGNGNVTTTLNGEQMLSAGSITTITPDFADIPSTMVSGLDVYKSPEAKHLVSGLAGTINLRTSRPFSLEEGLTAVAKAEATYGSLGKEVDPGFSAFVGWNNNDRLGVSLNLSKSTSYLADYNNGAQGAETGQYGGWSFNASEASSFVVDNLDVNGDGDTNDVFYAFQGHQAGNRFIDRDRTGLNGTLQFRLNDAISFTGDVFYTKMEEYQYFAGFVASQGWQNQTGWFTPDPGGLSEYPNINFPDDELTVNEGNYYTVQSAEYQARAIKTHTQTWAIDKEALNTNLQMDFEVGAISGKVRWIHAEGTNDMARSIVDAHIDSGVQRGDVYQAFGEDPIDANPWGYDGVPAYLPDGSRVPQLDENGNPVTDGDGNPVYADPYYVIPVGISYNNGRQNWTLPMLTVTESDGSETTELLGSNLARYSAKSTNVYGEYTNASLDALRVDASISLNFNHLQSLDVGARYGTREVEKSGWYGGVARTNQYGDAFLARWKDTATRAPYRAGEEPPGGEAESYIEPISFTELQAQGMITAIDDFHGTSGLGTLYFIDPKAMKDPLAWHEKMYGTNITAPDAANVYTVEEATSSAFIQANLEGELFTLPYRANIGFRYVNTAFDVAQSEALQGESAIFGGQEFLLGPGMVAPVGNIIKTDTSYSDVLPAFNFAADLTDNQILRASYNKSVSTHNTDMLGGGLTVNRVANCGLVSNGATVFCATGGGQEGNPTLEPNRNTNADISYEWYFADSSLLSVGLFWVQANTGFESVTIQRDDIPDSDGVVRGYDLNTGEFRGYVEIQTTITTEESSETYGAELGYRQSFDFLDGFWGGFGIDANFTYSPSDGSNHDYYGDKNPASGNSEYQTNFALWYEAHGWEARIAHNYRSEMFVSRKQEVNYHFGYWVAPTNYVDASLAYQFNDWAKISLQATNLTEEYIETYHQWENHIDGRFYNERRLTLGFQLSY